MPFQGVSTRVPLVRCPRFDCKACAVQGHSISLKPKDSENQWELGEGVWGRRYGEAKMTLNAHQFCYGNLRRNRELTVENPVRSSIGKYHVSFSSIVWRFFWYTMTHWLMELYHIQKINLLFVCVLVKSRLRQEFCNWNNVFNCKITW